MDISIAIMQANGVTVDQVRAVDYQIVPEAGCRFDFANPEDR